ncbi:MAG: DUF1800 domain-containing protein [Burkholderiaceae bacterium]|nr:MAG: DUF1800 domain-containing protein [Burkholderiaceae bacterium]
MLRARQACRLALWIFALAATALPFPGHAAVPLGEANARVLLTRLGFAPASEDVAAFAGLTQTEAVDRLLYAAPAVQTPVPESVRAAIPSHADRHAMSEEDRRTEHKKQVLASYQLGAWWVQEMIVTPAPLRERMTLFWHNHFVSSEKKVKAARLLYEQNVLLRQQALGNFATLLHAISKDPAMLIYLDSATNRKGQPNENFAREVMELFTLGEGHYTEQDIKEAARAFTGWSLDPQDYHFIFRRFTHDDGIKTVLGQRGNFDGDAVLDILLAQPATAEFIVRKLWREFVSPTPDPAEVRRIAAVFRSSGYEIKPMLRALFNEPQLLAEDNRGTLVKSPIELLVGTVRQFNLQYSDAAPFLWAARQSGQDLFDPPNVKGWPGGEAWINSATLLMRKQQLEQLFRAVERPARQAQNQMRFQEDDDFKDARKQMMLAARQIYFPADDWFRQWGTTLDRVPDAQQLQRLEAVILTLPPVNPLPAGATSLSVVRTLLLDPVYQLK